MGFLEKLSNRVRSTDTSQVTHTVDIEEEKLTNEHSEEKNADEKSFSISTVVSSLAHFWNNKNKTTSKDSLNSELPEQDSSNEEIAEQIQDDHSFFDSVKESLVKGSIVLKDSISNQADTLEKTTSTEINDSTHIDDAQLEINTESESTQSLLSENTSYESLKNFFGRNISKIKETVSNIDNLADSLGSDNSKDSDNEEPDSTNKITETLIKPESDKQKPVVAETKEKLLREVENKKDPSITPPSHTTNELQSENSEEAEISIENNLLSYSYAKSIFDKSFRKIKETVSNIDNLADSANSNESGDESSPDAAEITIEVQNTTIIDTENKAPLVRTKEKVDSTFKEESPTGSEEQTNATQPIITDDKEKSLFSQSLNKIKKTTQSIDISNSMKGLIDKGADKINRLGSSDNLDIDIDLNESETAIKKESLEQLIAESVTETQKLAQIFDADENSISEEEKLTEEDKTTLDKSAKKVTETTLSSTKNSISAPAIHYMTQKMTASVANIIDMNFKSSEETTLNPANTFSDANLETSQLKQDVASDNQSITDSTNTLTDDKKTMAPSSELGQNQKNTLTDSHLGHSINLKEPTIPTSRQINQTALSSDNTDQEGLSDIPSEKREKNPYDIALQSKIPPVSVEKINTNEAIKIDTHHVDNIKDTPDLINSDFGSTAKNTLTPENHSIKNDLSDLKDTTITKNTEIKSQSTQDPAHIQEKADGSSTMPLIESSILKAEQLASIAEYKVNKAPVIEDMLANSKAPEKPLEIKYRGLFWAFAFFLSTMILAGLWWLTFSDNNQHSKDTDFVRFESLAIEESERKVLNKPGQTDNLPIDSHGIAESNTQLETTPIEKKAITNITENDSNLSDQPIINIRQNNKPESINSVSDTLTNQSNFDVNTKVDTTNIIAQHNTLPTVTNDIVVNTHTQDSIINNPIANITTFLNNKDGSLPKGFILHGLTFETASSRLSKSSTQIITDLATLLKAHPSIKIRLEGHTDSLGNAQKNQRLSAKRAQAVKSKLVNLDIDSTRIKVAGLGEEFPIMDNETKIGQQKNRRVEVIIVDGWFLK